MMARGKSVTAAESRGPWLASAGLHGPRVHSRLVLFDTT